MSLQHRQDVSEIDLTFDMERLFDPYNFDHIPSEKRLDLFKKRDLAHIKHYKAAVKIFGGPQKRTRAILAPPMETPFKHRLGHYLNVVSQPPSLTLNGSLKAHPVIVKEPSEKETKFLQESEKRSKYKSWIEKRKRLRVDLDNLALSEALLSRKTNKSELEKRVQAKFRSARLWKPDEPSPPDIVPAPRPRPDVPRMTVPPPDGLQILDKFLSLNHIRLMDLFLLADKDKSWNISREKFLSLVQQSKIPLSEAEIDDLIITLDSDLDDQLNYQELHKGLTEWRRQRRVLKRQSGEGSSSCTSAGSHVHTNSPSATSEKNKCKEANTLEQERPAMIISDDKITRKESASSTNENEDNAMQSRYLHDPTVLHSISVSRSQTDGIENVSEQQVQISEPESRYLTSVASRNQPTALEDRIKSQEQRVQVFDNYSIKESQLIKEEDKTFSDLVKTNITSENSRPVSHKSSRTHSSTSNTLEPPELDLRPEARMTESPEAMLDIRKHDQVVLKRNSMKRNMSVDQRLTFDEIPGVIKVGYKPIDDHCSESTLSGPVSKMVNQFRREKLREYFEVIKIFEEIGLPLTQKTLDRVLLYPGDQPTNVIKNRLSIPSGPLRNGWIPLKQNQAKTNMKKSDKGKQHSPASDMVNPPSAAPPATNFERGRGPGVGQVEIETKDEDGDEDARQHSKRSRSKKRFVPVEEVYPMASKVRPKVTEEDLSSGVALIKRRVDNWMTFEEYSNYTRNIQKKFDRTNQKSNPDAVWSGHLLDKIRLCMDYNHPQGNRKASSHFNRESCGYDGIGEGLYNGRGNAVFYETTNTKRVYPGYNNDLLTWPVGENGVRYGSIDEHRIIR